MANSLLTTARRELCATNPQKSIDYPLHNGFLGIILDMLGDSLPMLLQLPPLA